MELLVKIVDRQRETDDIVALELASNTNVPLPPFTAGAHIDVYVRSDLVRQYSLCNSPTERHRYVLAVLREPQSRGGSKAIHESLSVNDTLRISTPRNQFRLQEKARLSLLFAGGIGVTPLLAMAEQLAHDDTEFAMYYFARSESRTAFLQRIASSRYAQRVHYQFDDMTSGSSCGAIDVLDDPLPDTHLYICGPGGFIDYISNTAFDRGWHKSNIHSEHFSNSNAVSPSPNGNFKIQIASTGFTYDVPPGSSVVEVLRECGISIPVSCEQGICGTCITRVLAGEVDHHDMYLTEAEKALHDQFTPCCSRSKSPVLVLDL